MTARTEPVERARLPLIFGSDVGMNMHKLRQLLSRSSGWRGSPLLGGITSTLGVVSIISPFVVGTWTLAVLGLAVLAAAAVGLSRTLRNARHNRGGSALPSGCRDDPGWATALFSTRAGAQRLTLPDRRTRLCGGSQPDRFGHSTGWPGRTMGNLQRHRAGTPWVADLAPASCTRSRRHRIAGGCLADLIRLGDAVCQV